jgi:hypothetical protein
LLNLLKGQSYVENILKQVAFGEPDKATADVDLTEGGVQTEEDYDPNDDE